MKKVIYMIFILSLNLYAEEIDINKLIEKYLGNSIEVKIYNIEKDKVLIEKEAFKNKNTKQIDYKLQLIEDGSNYSSLDYTEETLNMELSYRDFFISKKFNGTKNKLFEQGNYLGKESDELNIGYRRNLKDILYSNKKIQNFILDKKESKVIEKIKSEKVKGIEDIIKKYIDILNSDLQIELNKAIEVEYVQMVKNLNASLLEGETTKIELEIAELELEKLKEKIIYFENKLKIQKNDLSRIVGFENGKDFEFKKMENLEFKDVYVNKYEFLNLNYEKEILKEKLLFTKKQLFGEINTELSYDTLNESINLSFQISGSIFDYKQEEKSLKKDLEEIEYKIEKINQDMELEVEKKKLEYNELLRMKKEAELDMKIQEKKKILSEKMFKEGYTNLKELINSKNEYIKAKLEYEISSNNLNEFILKQSIYKSLNSL